jgi:hypothetical protein
LAFGKTITNTTGSLKALLFRLVMNKKSGNLLIQQLSYLSQQRYFCCSEGWKIPE